ncbi:MAG: hypothetical protein ACQEXO_10745 [Pseudomonadota bacterium]
MGMEDRDYYWEDRKRREKKFDKKDTYYRSREYMRRGGQKPGMPPNDWQITRGIGRRKWTIIIAFFSGCFITLWSIMIILHLNPELLWVPFKVTRKALSAIGFL